MIARMTLAAGLLVAASSAEQPGTPAAPETAPEPTPSGRSAANNPLEGELTPAVDASVTKGLSWLAQQQNDDGSFGTGRYGRNVAVTSLACLAFMADGHVPGRGEYGPLVERGLEFVLNSVAENGLITAQASHGPMYGHGFATLFLGEVYGMTSDPVLSERTHEALIKAVRLIEQSQNEEGGWRYNPVPYDADVSVTICQVMALRSARNAGLAVDKQVIDRAVEYVRRCQNPDGGFRYQLIGGPSAWPRSAAGVATLFYAGIYEGQDIDSGLEYLNEVAFPGQGLSERAHYWYGQYYAVQTVFLAGGDSWERWWPAVRRELLDDQLADGSWVDRTVGPVYGTSMALIVLQMPKRYLPIFQK